MKQEKNGLKEDSIKWIQIIIQNQEFCVFSGVITANHFKFGRVTRQGDPISSYKIMLVLEISFLFIMQNENFNGLNIFQETFLYKAYADDTTSFLKDQNTVISFQHFPDINRHKQK